MTEPRDMQHELHTEATAADGEPEVRPEVIQDLDLANEEAEDIRGGCSICQSIYPSGRLL
jgi:hypothetical protein